MKKIYYLSKYVLLFALFIFAQQALISAPTQKSPANADDCVDRDAVFEWTRVSDASHYMYVISTKNDFSDTVKKDLNYSDTTVAFELPNYSTKYYWKVGVHIINETDEWSEHFNFTTHPAPPALTTPDDMLECQVFSQTFSWTVVPNATKYKIQISSSPNFSPTVVDTQITGTTASFDLDKYFTTYYWRVKGIQVGCETPYSESRRLTTLVGPPEMATPRNDSVGTPLDVIFTWPAAGGAQSYDLQVSDDANFSNLLVNQMNMTGLSFAWNPPNYNKKYYWRMRTLGQACTSEWSKAFNFKTAYPAAVATSPGDTLSCVPIVTTFTWAAVPGATHYEIQASKTPIFSKANNDITFSQVKIAGTSITGDVLLSTKQVWWRVRANDDNNVGLWSEAETYFTTGAAPLMKSPVDGTTEVPRGITFEWEPNSGSSYYNLQISKNISFTDLELDESGIIDKNFTVILESYNTPYYYRVRTFLSGCFSDWSNVYSLKSIQGFPNLIYPENAESNITTEVQFQWSVVPTANNYDIRFSTDDEFVNEFGQNGIKTNSILQKDLLPNTVYYWMVRSNDQWGTSPWSQVYQFTTGEGFTNVPFLLYPENLSIKLPTTGFMYWNSSSNATSYNLQIAEDLKFKEGDIVKEIQNIKDTSYNYTDLDSFKEYWFRVASVNQTTTSAYSKPHRFRTIAQPPTDQALAIKPEDGENEVSFKKTVFEWTKVARTDLGLSSESGYELLISKTQDFADTVIYNQRVFEETINYENKLDLSTTYFWKTRGWNEAGFGPWSEAFSFTTDIQSTVTDGNFDFGTSIVPNPIQNRAELRFNLDTPGNVNFIIVDQTGRTVFNLENINGNGNLNILPLNLDNLSNGSYLFKLQTGTKYQSGKIIISR
ncbi:MAG: T9SS type A sorting domain-containing protein [Candidatus Kapaibacterium sp.]